MVVDYRLLVGLVGKLSWDRQSAWHRGSIYVCFYVLPTSMDLTVGLVVPVWPFPVLIRVLVRLPANSSWLDIKALSNVVAALWGIVSKNGNIPPWGWMPIWVVVSFLGTLISTSVSIAILAGIYGRAVSVPVAAKVLVSSEQTLMEKKPVKVSWKGSSPQMQSNISKPQSLGHPVP